MHAMAVGVAASASALVVISGGTPARSSDAPLGGRPSLSVFGTIHPELTPYRVPVGAQTPRVQLASLETDFTTDTVEAAEDTQTTAPVAPADGASFTARFNSSFGERLSSFEERFATRTGDSDRMGDWVQPPQTLALAEPGSDVPMPPEGPKRQNVRLASLGAPPSVAAGTRASIGTPRGDALSPEL